MRIFEFIEKMYLFGRLIEQERTGNPEQFAERLGISRAYLYLIIEELSARGVEIKYSRTKESFYYASPAVVDIRFDIKPLESLSERQLQEISGGRNIFCSVYGSRWNGGNFVLERMIH